VGKKDLIRKTLAVGIIFLFIVSSVTPIVFGYNNETIDIEQITKNIIFNNINKHNYPEGYSAEKRGEPADNATSTVFPDYKETTVTPLIEKKNYEPQQTLTSDGPMDSPWPMFMHDVRHTGRSPYSTANNPYDEKWYFKEEEWGMGSPVIDNEGVIYFCPEYLYAIYTSNGTLKWKYEDWYGTVAHTAPAIDENGTVYVGLDNIANSNNFYAFYPNGTVKWIYPAGDCIYSSPAIGDDSVYFAAGKYFYSVYPNGTLKWKYKAGDYFWGSSPAIGLDGTVYKYNTGTWVHGSATIGDDGTVYIGSDNSLYALYPNNGTMKWRCSIGGIWSSPTLGVDGTIYVGVFEEKFYAIYPNGTIKWMFDAGGRIWFGSSAALSADGTLYFGTTSAMGGHGSDFIALNLDGTEKWRYSPGWYESSIISCYR